MTASFYADVADAVARGAVSLRFRDQLEPTAGAGHPFQPPTYALSSEMRTPYAVWQTGTVDANGDPEFTDGVRTTTMNVTVDSEGSQANRAEEGLSYLREIGALDIPVLELTVNNGVTADVSAFRGERRFTNLTTPHRQLDPIFRFGLVSRAEYSTQHPDDDISSIEDVEPGLVPFARTPLGRDLITSPANDLTALLTYAPASLLFGFWGSYSNGQSPERPRLARRYASTITAHDVDPVTAGSTKMSLFNEGADVKLGESSDPLLFDVGMKNGKGKPSNIGAGSIISSVHHHGFTARRIDWTTTISIRGLLQTPLGPSITFEQRQGVAAALLVLGIAGRAHADLFLRSGCDLNRTLNTSTIEWLFPDGSTKEWAVDSSPASIRAAFTEAKQGLVDLGGPVIGSADQSVRLHLSPGYRQLIDSSNEVPSIFKTED
jgi:hypothetical protein